MGSTLADRGAQVGCLGPFMVDVASASGQVHVSRGKWMSPELWQAQGLTHGRWTGIHAPNYGVTRGSPFSGGDIKSTTRSFSFKGQILIPDDKCSSHVRDTCVLRTT